MKRLTLLRHAKSSWDDHVSRDFDRPLNKRGARAAMTMGRYARNHDMHFDHLIASPAVRVIQTLDTFLDGYGEKIEANWDRRIYLASSATLMDVLRDQPNDVSSLLMLGHNPGLEDLILTLVPDNSASALRDDVEIKFPTASLAVMEIDIDKWDDMGPNMARLVSFTRPRDLDPTLGPDQQH
ncbi:SixA phosphatase family protein [Rhizorhapis sp. SPR117]|uniref:SixA phosphatase family protein n=1 Tax=Rhizorhapis sp. SPR117 TaxID=2912611 RepID=UPI001F1B5443|nr:histidine phosphatase family protein [Rhizorhapis sp. SPR117]